MASKGNYSGLKKFTSGVAVGAAAVTTVWAISGGSEAEAERAIGCDRSAELRLDSDTPRQALLVEYNTQRGESRRSRVPTTGLVRLVLKTEGIEVGGSPSITATQGTDPYKAPLDPTLVTLVKPNRTHEDNWYPDEPDVALPLTHGLKLPGGVIAQVDLAGTENGVVDVAVRVDCTGAYS